MSVGDDLGEAIVQYSVLPVGFRLRHDARAGMLVPDGRQHAGGQAAPAAFCVPSAACTLARWRPSGTGSTLLMSVCGGSVEVGAANFSGSINDDPRCTGERGLVLPWWVNLLPIMWSAVAVIERIITAASSLQARNGRPRWSAKNILCLWKITPQTEIVITRRGKFTRLSCSRSGAPMPNIPSLLTMLPSQLMAGNGRQVVTISKAIHHPS